MTTPTHTYGQNCRLRPVSDVPAPAGLEDMPPIRAQFFYSAPFSIDDPLSTAPVAGSTNAKAAKGVQRPFSVGDNNALEEAWLSLGDSDARATHQRVATGGSLNPFESEAEAAKVSRIIHDLVSKHHEKHQREGISPTPVGAGGPAGSGSASTVTATADTSSARVVSSGPIPLCCAELELDASAQLRESFCELSRRQSEILDEHTVLETVMGHLKSCQGNVAATSASMPAAGSFVARAGSDRKVEGAEAAISSTGATSQDMPPSALVTLRPALAVLDDGISGKPFLRVGAEQSPSELSSVGVPGDAATPAKHNTIVASAICPQDAKAHGPADELLSECEAQQRSRRTLEILVGISRLHTVSLPVLQMKPIYWSPVGDVAAVLRATWFYQDTMEPVEAPVANQLEVGYRDLRAYTETWQDELRSAIDVGAVGEEKVSHPLWPPPPTNSFRRASSRGKGTARMNSVPTASKRTRHLEDGADVAKISSDPYCAARCFRGEAAAQGTTPSLVQLTSDSHEHSNMHERPYSAYHVLYRGERTAFLLKPSLRPSGYYNRRPLSKIMRGTTVGIPVIRGFDRAAWIRLHGQRVSAAGQVRASAEGYRSDTGSQSVDQNRNGNSTGEMERQGEHPDTVQGDWPDETCPGCIADREVGQVTDLVLVIHGIGQKFAERVESFHFTHAINAFRRAVNLELSREPVKSLLRPGQHGVMILPVNWRHTVSFDDAAAAGGMTSQGKMSQDEGSDRVDEGTRSDTRYPRFNLKDIEPHTIPAVRGIISDVMFDIPFYLSHHKPKMIAGLVGEANRVYRLWCSNNPGFLRKGRVHLIGHSLGSAMALDVLSRQPTRLPPGPPPSFEAPDSAAALALKHFDFDTTNLFLLGSPAGFFLLLERGRLLPRRGRGKPGADAGEYMSDNIVGEAGQFGCLAVDNVYNVLAREDPIAYLLNGTIDPAYAATLRAAYVPSTATSLLTSMGNALRAMTGAAPAPTGSTTAGLTAPLPPPKPPPLRLPSQLEMEVHDFTREELAEKKAYLLNDNGQIDFYLRSSGGPLEIQYLNMLSAHTSYWTNQDLIRMLCVEVGRKPGRTNTLPSMRAVKKRDVSSLLRS